MKHSISFKNLIFTILVGLSGCGRVVDWGKDSFKQGKDIEKSTVPQEYLRSIRMYDQLTTAAAFDALWLSNEVREAYTDLNALRHGKTEEQRKSFLRRQLKENDRFISFYILSLDSIPLGDPSSQWSLFLEVNGNKYTPIEVKTIDLEPEYQSFFDKKYSRFKTAYRVKFDSKDVEDQFIIDRMTKKIELFFRSVDKETSLMWDIEFD